MTTANIEITAEVTPNPNTLKFNVSKTLLETGSVNFTDREKAKGAYLPEKLFEIENVLGVMVGTSFITVTKAPASNWKDLVQTLTEKIKEILSSDKTLLPSGIAAVATASGPGANTEIERKIKEILDNEIRPAVAMDGGDIQFYGYQDGIVTLHLQGSCSSCPSSVMTLKMGVENRLKSLIPEVREVVQV
jgi:Fe-S cluster biogenesis protein NfuA